jgi:hypothetical protein
MLKENSVQWKSYNKIPINGEQARVPLRWSWKEDWKISISLMPFSQPDKSVKTPLNRI